MLLVEYCVYGQAQKVTKGNWEALPSQHSKPDFSITRDEGYEKGKKDKCEVRHTTMSTTCYCLVFAVGCWVCWRRANHSLTNRLIVEQPTTKSAHMLTLIRDSKRERQVYAR